MDDHPDIKNLMPPGTYLEKLPHPNGSSSEVMELAIFTEHRFSFYFWNRWFQKIEGKIKPPALVTFDWHRDFAPPSTSERNMLENLNLTDEDTVAKEVWASLDSHNDSHLLSAAHLNIIGDIFLLKNYGDAQQHTFNDQNNQEHKIEEFRSYHELEKAVRGASPTSVILDIDLDFFIRGKNASHQLEDVQIYEEDSVAEIIDNTSPLFSYLFSCLEGITIATEPRYCGGILKSNRILEMVLGQLFNQKLAWKHLETDQ